MRIIIPSCAAALLVGMLCSASVAQQADSLAERVAQIEKDLKKIQDDLLNVKQVVNKFNQEAVAPLAKSLETLEKNVQSLSNAVQGINEGLSKDLPKIDTRLDAIDNLLKDVVESDGTQSFPNIFGNMQKSDAFREQFVKATQGALLVTNNTGMVQVLHVNGTAWEIRPGGPWKILTPMGEVTTHLRPYEEPRLWPANTWKLRNNRYEMQVMIGF